MNIPLSEVAKIIVLTKLADRVAYLDKIIQKLEEEE